MLVVLSPAKSLDLESRPATRKHSQPRLLDAAAELVEVMLEKSPADLQKLMGISQSLAETNAERFEDFTPPFTPKNARAAILTFAGDVYMGMDAPNSFTERDYTEAQKTIRILSGLYGVLRPLDLIQPYRLEMGLKVKTDAGSDLYKFWGNRITELLKSDLAESPGPPVLVNLASNEYFKAVRPGLIEARILTPTFLDSRDGESYSTVGFFAKRARGSMAGWLVKNRVRSVRALSDFDGMGYKFDPGRSRSDQPTFTRISPPLVK